MTVKHPLVLWAQRSGHVFLSLEVEDMKIDNLVVDGDTFKISGKKGNDVYEADLKLYGKLLGAERRQIATDRRVELVIPKETAEWWPRLLQEKARVPWVKVDFDKWKEEDEEDEEAEGGMDFGGMGGMDFSNFGLPGGDASKGFNMDDLNFNDDGDDDNDDAGELEDIESDKNDEDHNDKEAATKTATVEATTTSST